MSTTQQADFIIGLDDLVLVTGATGFIGSRVVETLLERGFRNLRCLTRPSSDVSRLEGLGARRGDAVRLEVIKGNLLSALDCAGAVDGAAVIYHLATSRDGRSYPDAFMNSVVTTRNLLDAARHGGSLRRFVNISSLAVYTNTQKPRGRVLDETCPIETHPALRGDAYCFSKVKQDEIVVDYGKRFGLPYVIVRPGYVYGPGKVGITSRVGIGTFGVFLHLGGSNRIPFTFVDNCADAIVLAGVQKSIDNDVFNIVDDDLPSSRQFLRQYKRNVRRFTSLYVPHAMSYVLCYLWERYSTWSEGQLPPVFNRRHWHAFWKQTRYTNDKLKTRVGWTPRVSSQEGLRRYFEACRDGEAGA
jgi:nucleoside-diphosphate-sugar epimerase